MSTTARAMPLAEAQQRASALLHDLAPSCERLEVAGSIRRECVTCSDIELCAIPRFVPAGLFGDQQANALWAHLTESPDFVFLKGNSSHGRYFQVGYDGAVVDIFTAQPENYGWIHLLRTGSAPFSQAVLTEWKRLKGIGRDQLGSKDGFLVDRYGRRFETPTEEDVFALIRRRFIAPRERVDGTLPPRRR